MVLSHDLKNYLWSCTGEGVGIIDNSPRNGKETSHCERAAKVVPKEQKWRQGQIWRRITSLAREQWFKVY